METALEIIRQAWAGRSVGRALLAVGLAVCAWQAYRRWQARRAAKNLAGKVILITGASSGLGEALARVLHSVGSKVILASRNMQQLERLKFELDSIHEKKPSSPPLHPPKVVHLDLSSSTSIATGAREALEAFGHIDVLINNAGLSSRGGALETALAVDRKVMEVNFFGTVALTKAIVPSMLEQGRGHVVAVSSLQGKIGLPMRSSYSASKHALQGFFDSLRVELAPLGLDVTVVSPGYIHTRLSINAMAGDGSKHGVLDKNTASGMSPAVAAERIVIALARRERELVLASHTHRLALYLRLFCPSLLDWLLRARAKST